jgi:hypothetical protein
MAETNVTRTLDADPDALWNVVRDFGNVPWIPGGENAEIRGDGVGQVRIFDGPNGKVHEHLTARDDDARSLTYVIPEGVPFPVTGYTSTMVVSDDGGKGRLSWSCAFEPDGASEDEAAQAIQQMYGVMIGWIDDLLKQTG